MSNKFKYLIIGAGPTGLGAAYRLKELGENSFLILEKESGVGGLSGSVTDEKGFTWDFGGHVQFSHYKYFDQVMNSILDEKDWIKHVRSSWIYKYDRYIPYPFQNNIHRLPLIKVLECWNGLMRRKNSTSNPAAGEKKSRRNFKQWTLDTFGKGLANEFMLPYNYKVWGYDPSQLASDWIEERVATPDLKKISRSFFFHKTRDTWGPNAAFRFPKKGGTGFIWDSLVDKASLSSHLILDEQVLQILGDQKKVILRSGKEIEFEKIISTIPLDELVGMMNNSSEEISTLSKKLKYSSTHIVGIGLKGKVPGHLSGKSWIYFPEDNSPYYRITVFSNYSPNNVPNADLYWSLLTETSETADKPVNSSSITAETINALIEDKLIKSREDVYSVFTNKLKYGYPTPSIDRDEILKILIPHFEKMNIYSRGRFGAWKYEVSNQDHSFMQGVEVINRLHLNIPEQTL